MTDDERLARDQARLERFGRLHWFHWLIVAGSLAITLLAWHASKRSLEERVALRFDREVERVVDLFTEQLQRQVDVLQSTASLLGAREDAIGYAEWNRYHEGLDLPKLFPALDGIDVIHYVRADEVDAFVARQRIDYPDYELHPAHDQPFHLAIVHSSESARGDSIGFDMAHDEVRRDLIERTIRMGHAQITAPIDLTYSDSTGFLMFAPFHRGDVEGWERAGTEDVAGTVLAVVRVERLASGVLDRKMRSVSVSISDDGQVLYDEHDDSDAGADPLPLFERTVSVPMFDRAWRFDIRTTEAFRADAASIEPLLILAGGLLIDLLLLVLFTLLSRANRHALCFADRTASRLRAQGLELEQSNQELESFAYVVSHDLKAPLQGIEHLADFIEEDLEGYLRSGRANPDVVTNFERMHRQIGRANALICGILIYSRLDDQAEQCQLVDTRGLVEQVAEGLGIRRGKLIMRGDFPKLDTEVMRLDQVFANLIGNAFKYHHDPERAVVTVTGETASETFGLHRFTVSDDGPGIEARFHDSIFDLFTTLQSRDDVESSGVGLSIVKKTVELMGGTISVDSVPGEGTSFSFEWPTGCAEQSSSSESDGDAAEQSIDKAA